MDRRSIWAWTFTRTVYRARSGMVRMKGRLPRRLAENGEADYLR